MRGAPCTLFSSSQPFSLPASPCPLHIHHNIPLHPLLPLPSPKPPAVCKAQTAPTPKKTGVPGVPVLCPPQNKSGFRGVPVLCPLQTWGFGGVPHALPPLPNQSHRAGSVRATGSSPLPSPGQPPPIPSSPHVLCPLLGVAGPWGPPWPPCSSVVLCCSFRCL